MSDFEEWDSFGHLSLLTAIDTKLDGEVAKISEMSSADSVSKILELLKLHKLV